VEHANFFETRATEYSKGATRGQWNDVWDAFDRRQTVKGVDVANTDDTDPDMFKSAGIAAE
jgi:ribonucleoside-diphosphate reductase beta chain